MARATKVALMGLAVGLALTPTQAFAQQHGTPTESIAVSGQPEAAPSPSQVHAVLRSGADCYRKGDYELAARYLQQAKAGEANLNADEKRDLANWLSLNSTALDARRACVNQLKMAEDAAKAGKTQDASAWLKAAPPNAQFLSAADTQRMQQLTDRVMPGPPQTNARLGDTMAAIQRNKLQAGPPAGQGQLRRRRRHGQGSQWHGRGFCAWRRFAGQSTQRRRPGQEGQWHAEQ